jgi:hypothetical protein
MQSDLYEYQRRQIALIARVTPYAMAGHIANTTVIAIALAGSVRSAPLIIWCAYSYATAVFLLYRNVRKRGYWPRNFERAAKKATTYAFLLALPWSSLAVLYLGSLSQGQELLLVTLGIGMAACGTVLLSAIPQAAFSYMSVILIPSALKFLLLSQPPVLAPSQCGYGTSTIRNLIPFELGGKVELDYASEGVRCRLEIPSDWVSERGSSTAETEQAL